ncbi:MAG: carboxypeptidase regulatory-like domain-containing protein [Planctomycetota bacterium]|jgi:beta-lactamase regulating signal transducer with metallopeptidase domain
MNAFLEAAAGNAITVTILAAVVFAVTRAWRNEQAAHVLWLLVAVKFVTPPVFSICLPLPAEGSRVNASVLHAVGGSSPAESTGPAAFGDVAGPSPAVAEIPPPIDSPRAIDSFHQEPAEGEFAAASGGVGVGRKVSAWPGVSPQNIAIAIWLAGTLTWLSIVAVRLARFHLVVKQTHLAPTPVQTLARRCADRLGLARCPEVRFVEGSIAPMVWPAGWRPIVLLPARLSAELTSDQMTTILTHELVHVRRRDHWIRWLEIVVVTLYWWHPIAWWACREIQRAEEECCDGWVLRACPGKAQAYGEALFRTIEFVRRGRQVAPAMATGLNGVRLLKRRIEMILQGRFRGRLSWPLRCALVLTALAVLPVCVRGVRAERSEESTAPAEDEATSDSFDFRGKVVNPDGKPVEGAKIYLIYGTPLHPPRPGVRATTSADGSFRFTAAKSELDISPHVNESWLGSMIVAVAEGYGVDVGPTFCFDASGTLLDPLRSDPSYSMLQSMIRKTGATLRLARDDVPLVGRIVDAEGRPVAGASVRVLGFMAPANEDLTPWLDAVKKGEDYDVTRGVLLKEWVSKGMPPKAVVGYLGLQFQYVMPTATTDSDGKFRLTGIGRERIARLLFEGPGIASRSAYARTRPGPTYRLPHVHEDPLGGTFIYHGSNFQHTAPPSIPIRGTVRDKDTGKPLAGVTIQAQQSGTDPKNDPADMQFPKRFLRAVTDDRGRYRLTGVPVVGSINVYAVPPADEPYFLSAKPSQVTEGSDSAQLDFELKRGIWIRGCVGDAGTDEPLRVTVGYFARHDNPHARIMGELGWVSPPDVTLRCQTDAEGRYAIPGLPGRGIVTVFHWDGDAYPRGAGAEQIQGGEAMSQESVGFETSFGRIISTSHHFLAEVNLAEDAEVYQQDITLDSGQRLTGRVLDPAGRPLAGVFFSGTAGRSRIFGPLHSASFTVNSYRPEKLRTLLFVHEGQKLAGSLILEGPQQGPLSVRLQPWGTITGRIVDADGNPKADLVIVGWNRLRAVPGQGAFPERHYLTDQHGRFHIEGLAPGIPYDVQVHDPEKLHNIIQVLSDVTVKPGETKDLGDVTIRPLRRHDRESDRE